MKVGDFVHAVRLRVHESGVSDAVAEEVYEVLSRLDLGATSKIMDYLFEKTITYDETTTCFLLECMLENPFLSEEGREEIYATFLDKVRRCIQERARKFDIAGLKSLINVADYLLDRTRVKEYV